MKVMVFFLALCNTIAVFAAGNFQAGQEKSTTCAACHGPAGISLNPEWPSLAGQHTHYLIKQLHDMKDNHGRNVPVMTAIIAPLTEQDIADLATFYSKQPLPKNKTPQRYVNRGQQLYRGGDFTKQITACIACHGPQATGNAQAGFPVLSGQHANYTVQQLQAFKDNKRSNDLNAIMRDISKRMDNDDMIAVANYIAGLH